MTSPVPPGPDGPQRSGDGVPDGPGGDDPDRSGMAPTSPTFLLGFVLAGLVLGRLVRPGFEAVGQIAPVVTWAQPTALAVVAGVLAVTARATRRVVRARGEPLAVHQAVNRLLLARASAVVGALVGGGYVGYALAWIGSASQLADERIVRSLLCAAAAAAVAGTALLLERACRVPPGDAGP